MRHSPSGDELGDGAGLACPLSDEFPRRFGMAAIQLATVSPL
jgi:hypothetical protein